MRSLIEGEKIVLRKYETAFAPMLYEAAFESRGGEFSRWMPWCRENYTLAESESFIERTLANQANESEYAFAVFDRQSGGFVGGVGLNQFNSHHNFVNLGYWIRTSRQNRGFASEATRLLAQAAFADLPLNRIEVLVAAENKPSQKAAEKSGAAREGVLRKRLVIGGQVHDAVMFSFVREDFNS
jgi:RimJ/RimL family protein N-acetyltransferase